MMMLVNRSEMLARPCLVRAVSRSRLFGSTRFASAAVINTTAISNTFISSPIITPTHPSPTIIRPSLSSFSTSARSDLSDLLARELAEEEGSMDMPPDLLELKEQLEQDWRIVDDPDSGIVQLFSKAHKGVALSFHCQDTLESPSDIFDENEEEQEEPAVAVRFTLTISKAGKTLVFTCLCDMGVPTVERVAMTTQDDIESIQRNNGVDDNLYQGPEFNELPEDLQQSFQNLVQKEYGVNTNVAAFISMYADYKEQAEYVRWLKQIESLL